MRRPVQEGDRVNGDGTQGTVIRVDSQHEIYVLWDLPELKEDRWMPHPSLQD
jgi:hypothetical protein